jgi:hypothetical protein
MSKMSVLSKGIAITILIALVLSFIPMITVVAKGNNGDLETKWSQLVTNYDRQYSNHTGVHKWVDHWFKTHKKASLSDKAEVQKHVAICNSAILAAGTIISKHTGFDARGTVIDRASAIKSIENLRYFLRQHAGSVKNLKEHIKK